VVAVIFLLVAGAMVTSTGSGLAVPDWPLSFGQVMPPMKGGVFYEHGHRMVATGIGILTVILSVWMSRVEPRRWMRRLGWTALLLVILQGVLGGATVLLKLPVWTSAAHACLAQGFFMVVVFIALALSPGWNAPRRAAPVPTGVAAATAVATAVIYAQLVLGAVMRHMNAGLAIPDFPLAFGRLIPPAFTPGVAVHYAHRLGALAVTIAVGTAVWRVMRSGAGSELRRPALAAAALVVIQATLGAFIIWTQRAVPVATAHVVTGAILLAVSLVLTARSWHRVRPDASPARVAAPERSPLGEATA
jgi:cytochrome c oxidase assembly protein subunit 15